MKTRTLRLRSVQILTVCLLAVSLILGLTWALAQAAGPPPPAPPWDEPAPKPFSRLASIPDNASTQDAALGEPGLSFRYVRIFGETEVAYFDDPDHLNGPKGIGTDGTHVWIAECEGQRALKYTNDGRFVMQIGKAGVQDVAGTVFNCLQDVAVDSSGNVWVVDVDAHHVIQFDSSGNRLSELGQTWNPGSDNDHFNQPYSIAFDTAGHIYVSDWRNHRIQVFDSDADYVTTIGETGVSGSDNAHFNSPRYIDVDSNNLLYVADGDNHRVQIFDISASPAITYVATLGVAGEAGSDNAHFNTPEGVAVDVTRGRIYVADAQNFRVQAFDYTTRAYQTTLDISSYTSDVAVDAAGNLYVAEPWGDWSQVQQFDSDLNYVRTYGTKGVPYLTDGSHYNEPQGVAVAPDGSIYIGEGEGKRLVKLDANGVPQWIVGEAGIWGDDNQHFSYVRNVALGGAGRVYVADTGTCRVQIYNADGSYHATLGTGCGTGDDQFSNWFGLTVAPDGDIYVADTWNHRVQVFDSHRNYMATLGETGVAGSDNAHFNNPWDVAVDASGNIYVADNGNCRIQVFDPNRTYLRTIGVSGECNGNDELFDHFGYPTGIALDVAGRIYVADGDRVQVLDPNGAYLTTIGGHWGSRTGELRGSASDLAVDTAGNIYFADTQNYRVQKFAPGVPGWVQSNINGFGSPRNMGVLSLAPFAGHLYAGTYNPRGGAQLWRLDDVGWTAVITDGFGSGRNVGIDHLIEFKGELFAGTANYDSGEDRTYGGEVWRSIDGEHWAPIKRQGFGDPTNGEVFRFAVFSDTLYAGTWSYSKDHGAEIWRSQAGIAGDWNRVVVNGFDDAHNEAALSFEVFNGYLYAGTYNQTTGGEVWRTYDGTNWEQVSPDGFGDAENYGVAALTAFNGYLYAGTGHKSGAGGEVWRCQTCDGGDWQQVVDNGFGNPDTRSMPALEVYDNHLYFVVGNRETGLEIWYTTDGTNWEQVGPDGLGDSNNAQPYWDNSATVFNGNLYVGTWNHANGGEVWQRLHEVFLPLVRRGE